jgi:hypothetical protein
MPNPTMTVVALQEWKEGLIITKKAVGIGNHKDWTDGTVTGGGKKG